MLSPFIACTCGRIAAAICSAPAPWPSTVIPTSPALIFHSPASLVSPTDPSSVIPMRGSLASFCLPPTFMRTDMSMAMPRLGAGPLATA